MYILCFLYEQVLEMGLIKLACIVVTTAIIVQMLPLFLNKKLQVVGSGFAAPGWERVAQVFR